MHSFWMAGILVHHWFHHPSPPPKKGILSGFPNNLPVPSWVKRITTGVKCIAHGHNIVTWPVLESGQFDQKSNTTMSLNKVCMLLYKLFCFTDRGAGMAQWRERARLPPMWPGSFPVRYHLWVEFVVGSRPCSEGFLQVLPFSSLHKNQHSKFQFDLDTRTCLYELLSSYVSCG